MMDIVKEYYVKLGIWAEAQIYKGIFNRAVINSNWVDAKTAIGNYEETVETAQRYLGKDSALVGELEVKLEKMEAKEQWYGKK